VISYSDLLRLFWANHRPGYNNPKRQYWHAVFYRNEEQRLAAEASRDELVAAGQRVETEVIPLMQFTYAEWYHQKYYLTQFRELRAFFESTYPDAKSLADSTVATRLNAILFSGVGDVRMLLDSEIERYDLPAELKEMVLSRV
tara:strand:- start:2559 stop:2987 length:429 start_codon:yes stop_codon:yes gene_type:complete